MKALSNEGWYILLLNWYLSEYEKFKESQLFENISTSLLHSRFVKSKFLASLPTMTFQRKLAHIIVRPCLLNGNLLYITNWGRRHAHSSYAFQDKGTCISVANFIWGSCYQFRAWKCFGLEKLTLCKQNGLVTLLLGTKDSSSTRSLGRCRHKAPLDLSSKCVHKSVNIMYGNAMFVANSDANSSMGQKLTGWNL